ncbi:hypothetical protein RI367_001885 [Sorochytrium milnesiophthora]
MSSRNSHSNNPEGHNQYTKNNNNNSGRDYDNDDDNTDNRRSTGRHSNNPEGHNQYTKNSTSDDNANRRSSGNSNSGNSNSGNNSNNNQQGQGLQEGDHVTYHPIGSGDSNTATSTGTITQVLTEDTVVGSGSDKRSQPTVHASEDEPRYVIENDNTGKQTAYKAGNIEGSA